MSRHLQRPRKRRSAAWAAAGASIVALGLLPGPLAVAASVKSRDGVTLEYQVRGRGEPTLVLVHCWGCSAAGWSAQVEHFSRRQRVVTLDLAGHGRSGKNRREWSVQAFGEDVAAVVRRLDLRRAVLVGHSMGGPVILEAARRLEGRLVGLVPVDTLLDVDERPALDQMNDYLGTFERDFKTAASGFLRQYMFTKTTPAAFIEKIVTETTAMDPAMGVAVLRQTWTYDAAAALRELKLPIVAVNADLWPTQLAAARRHAPQYDVVLVPGLGHYLMREDPERFNRALEEALVRLTKPRP